MKHFPLLLIFLSCTFIYCSHKNENVNTKKNAMTNNSDWNELTDEETRVIVNKGTERPNIGEFVNNHKDGVYTCKRCDIPLFKSDTKFDSGCGWPSFDNSIEDAVEEVPDADGMRTEIVCNNCKGHLGHVFIGEGFTVANVRHCVNSISMNFEIGNTVPAKQIK